MVLNSHLLPLKAIVPERRRTRRLPRSRSLVVGNLKSRPLQWQWAIHKYLQRLTRARTAS